MLDFNLGSILEAFWNRRRLDDWSKLVFSIVFSTIYSVLYGTARSLLRDELPARAVGRGLLAGAVCGVSVFRKNPLAKELMVVLPGEEAGDEMDFNVQTISHT